MIGSSRDNQLPISWEFLLTKCYMILQKLPENLLIEATERKPWGVNRDVWVVKPHRETKQWGINKIYKINKMEKK